MRRLLTTLPVWVAATFVLAFPGAGVHLSGLHTPDAFLQASLAPARVDADRLLQDVRTLAAPEMEGRLTGTAGSRRAQAFILQRFRQIGLLPVNGSHQQTFGLGPTRRLMTREPVEGTNLFGLVVGTTEPRQHVLVGAHYDHLGIRGGRIYPGADDNASGVAAILAIAAYFAEHPLQRSVLFVAFDAEESGLSGSRHFVANPPIALSRITVMVNVDMIGRSDGDALVVAGTSHYPFLKPVVSAAAAGRQPRLAFGHDGPAADAGRARDWTHASDHGPFHSAGVPFLYFGVDDHADYHRATDTADRLDPQFFADATGLILETVKGLADGDR